MASRGGRYEPSLAFQHTTRGEDMREKRIKRNGHCVGMAQSNYKGAKDAVAKVSEVRRKVRQGGGVSA